MTTVQIAIEDRRYAAELSDLLVSEGTHSVHLLDRPDPKFQGVVVVDEKMLDSVKDKGRIDLERCIIYVRRLDFDAHGLFDAGIRHVIHADCPPEVGRLIVLAAERRLADRFNTDQRTDPSCVLFDTEDNLFLQALGIVPVKAGVAATGFESRDL